MQEYKNGGYGEIMEREALLKKILNDEEELEKTKVIHFGTPSALEAIKNSRISEKIQFVEAEKQHDSLLDRIEALEKEVTELKADTFMVPSNIIIPTKKEIDWVQNQRRDFLNKKLSRRSR